MEKPPVWARRFRRSLAGRTAYCFAQSAEGWRGLELRLGSPGAQIRAASPARADTPAAALELPPWVAAAWSVLNLGWKWLIIGQLTLPRLTTLPSPASSFLFFSSNLLCGCVEGVCRGNQNQNQNQTKPEAQFPRPGGVLCECLDEKLLHRKHHSILCNWVQSVY